MADQKSHEGITAPGLSEADQNINNTTEDHKANLSNPSKAQSMIREIC
jgi:hypothetical protein